MAGQKQNNVENKGFYKEGVFNEFVRWSALPPWEQKRIGIIDQGDFAKENGINKDTLTRWKQRPDFIEKVAKLHDQWGREKTPDIMLAIYRSAMKGSASSQRLWLKYFTDFDLKKSQKPQEMSPLLHEDDIRYIISFLPQELQDKYNMFLARLLDDSVAMSEGRLDDLSNSPNYDGL